MEILVELDKIAVQIEVDNWKDAIRAAGNLLVESEDIEQKYIEDMIASVEKLGPYIVISKGFALAHAEPCEAVKKTSISLINLKNPVNFGSNNDPVKVVMCLACTDKQSHIERLQKIAMKLMKEGVLDKMGASVDKEELYNIING